MCRSKREDVLREILSVLLLAGTAAFAGAQVGGAITVSSRISPTSGLPAGVIWNQVYTAYLVIDILGPDGLPTTTRVNILNTAPPGMPGSFSFTGFPGNVLYVECTAKLSVPIFLPPFGFTVLAWDVNGRKGWALTGGPNAGVPLTYIIDLHE